MEKTNRKTWRAIALFVAILVLSVVVVSSIAIAATIGYDDSYTHDGGSSSDAIAWGGSSLKTRLESYPSGTQVACFDWCNDGTLDSCYGSSTNINKCKGSSSAFKNICDAGKCFIGGVGDWHGIGTGSPGDKWRCSIWSRYYYSCTGTSGQYSYDQTPFAYWYYVVSPRQFDCDDQKTSTYDDEMSYGTVFDFRQDMSCSGNRLCDENKDDSSADYGTYGTSTPNEPCSVPDGNHDCDSDSDCFSGSECDCDGSADCLYDPFAGDKDYCCPSGQKWDGSKCATPCSPGYTGNKRCGSGNAVEEEYRKNDCSTEWKKVDDCDNYDDPGEYGSPYCDGEDYVKKKKVSKDYYCTGNGGCTSDDTTSILVVSENSNWDFCSKRVEAGCKCGNAKYDCENDNECYSGHCSCRGPSCSDPPDVLYKDYCCPQGQEWLDGQCCGDSDGDGHKGDNCGGDDCNDGDNKIYPGAAEKCNGVDDNCNKQVDEGDVCKCEVSKAYWDKSEVTEGEEVTLTAEGNSNCNGKTASFVVKEYDPFPGDPDDDVGTNPHSKAFSSQKAMTKWTAEWQDDCTLGICNPPPEYHFDVFVDGEKLLTSEEPRLTVNKYCPDNDGDGFSSEKSSCGKWDCNDGDNKVYPDAPELCDGKDNNCDNKIPAAESDNDGDGYRSCENDCKDDDRSINPGAAEACNGIDDNCKDGSDEGFTADDCSYLCSGDQTGGDDGIAYSTELFGSGNQGTPDCCGNNANEYYFTQGGAGCCDELSDCVNSAGSCVESGDGGSNWRCDDHQWSEECSNSKHKSCSKFSSYTCTFDDGQWAWRSQLPQEECNNFDDDCDDLVDDLTETKPCGLGVCAGGEQERACTAGAWGEFGACSTDNLKKNEVCNNKDDNCNGLTDEGNVCCDIPDGTSESCECDSNSDCPSGYLCYQRASWDPCEAIACKNECAGNGYFCGGGDVYHCSYNENTGCKEKKLSDVCGPKEACFEGSSSCEQTVFDVDIYVEDAPDSNVVVYKQPGDILDIVINSKGPQNVPFSAPDGFELVSGICFSQEASLASGNNECKLLIGGDVAVGMHYLAVADMTARVMVISKPTTIVLTNKEKLGDRFSNSKEVEKLLKQAFQMADTETNTVIYYLDREISGHPFESYDDYSQTPTENQLDNAYSYKVADLIRKKCNGCKNVILLGDDYVIPFYRADYDWLKSWYDWNRWFDESTETRTIITDQPYIDKSFLAISNTDAIFVETKKVRIVLDLPVSAGLSEELEELKKSLNHYYEIEVKEVQQIDQETVSCNDYSKLKDATLILIGNRDNNKAIKCVPWFDSGSRATDTFKASLSIERNVWGNNKYAIIVSGESPERGIQELNYIITNPERYENSFLDLTNSFYIHDISLPPDAPLSAGDAFRGYVLGQCEHVGDTFDKQLGCIGTDFVASAAPVTGILADARDTVMYCPTHFKNKITGKEEPLMNGFICYSSGTGTVVSVIGLGAAIFTGGGSYAGSTIVDAAIAAAKGTFKGLRLALKSNAGKVAKALDNAKFFSSDGFLKFSKLIREDEGVSDLVASIARGEKKLGEVLEAITSSGKRLTKILQANKKNFIKLSESFGEDAMAASLKTVDDYDDVAVGMKRVLGSHNTLEDFQKSAKVCSSPCRVPTNDEAVDIIKNVGRLFKNSVESITDFVTKQSSNIDDLAGKIKNGDFGEDAVKSFDGAAVGQLARGRAQNAASLINIQKETGGKLVKTEQEIFDKLASIGKGRNPPGADNVIEISGKNVGVSVKTFTSVKTSKIIDEIEGAAKDLRAAGDDTGFWGEAVLHIQVRAADYENALKLSKEYLDNPTNLKFIEDLYGGSGKFRVWVSKVEDYLVN